jgi:hypothetical protein
VKYRLKSWKINPIRRKFYRIPEETLRVKRKNILTECTTSVIVHLDRTNLKGGISTEKRVNHFNLSQILAHPGRKTACKTQKYLHGTHHLGDCTLG